MIDHLAPKFRSTSLARSAVHEPRAAFLLNRFSDTLPILYATHAAQFVLSCNPNQAVGRSFYEYIDEGYLNGAVNVIERAKENDSIAYLRLLWKESLEGPLVDGDNPMVARYNQEQVQLAPGIPVRLNLHPRREVARFEVECLVSASSDGLIVVVRRAPPIEGVAPQVRPPGIFASPWASSPLQPCMMTAPSPSPVETAPPASETPPENVPQQAGPSEQVYDSIRDVSVFAWSISTLNDDVSQDNVNSTQFNPDPEQSRQN
jgi:hypothetical protein